MARRDEEANKVISTAMRFVKTGDRSDLELFTLPILKKTIYQLGDLDKGAGFRLAIEDLIKEREGIVQQEDVSTPNYFKKISNFLSRKEWAGLGVILALLTSGISYLWIKMPEIAPPSKEISSVKISQNNDSNRRSTLMKLINSINSSEQEDVNKIYNDLLLLLDDSNASERMLEIVRKWKEPLTVKQYDNHVIISTVGQYKIDGFILFFDFATGELLSAYYDFGLGIKAIKVFITNAPSPERLVSVKYMTQSGTGLYGESVRIYAIEKSNINMALDKPYMEYIDGTWGAYKSDVTFEQNMSIGMKDSFPEITTKGYVTYTNAEKEELQTKLPDEIYIWDDNYKKFNQISGRITKGHNSMSDVYADYAEPNGDWFEAPKNANEYSFKPDDW